MKVSKTESVSLSYYSGKDIGNLLMQVRERYDSLMMRYPGSDVTNVELTYQTEYDSTSVVLEVTMQREETIQEERARVAQEKRQEAWQREQYAQLKKKFG